MNRRIALTALALHFALLIAVFGNALECAAEPGPKLVHIGFVSPLSPATSMRGVGALWERLRELGYVEGKNLVVEARWADGRIDRLAPLMAELVGRKVDVLVTYSTPGAVAARSATNTIPIVVATMGDPIVTGLAASLAHPGGNLTGLSHGYGDIGGKWLELLRETVPGLSTVAVVTNPEHLMNRDEAKELELLAPTHAIKVRVIDVRGSKELDRAFEEAGREAQAVLVLSDPYMFAHKRRIVALAANHHLPDMHTVRDFVDEGGLMTYGPNVAAMFRRAADYVDKILKGANPADLPIEQPTQYEFIINVKTAKALGLTIPRSVLVRADEVIK